MTSISYSGLTNYGKVSLPSVSNWGTNMNIVRDPPKSIMTRRIDKVGDNNDITKLIDASSDRTCEAISVYARGVNPMVSVSYNNSGGGQAYLPHRIMDKGAFRPPLRPAESLYPLSRLPRGRTSLVLNKGQADYSKKLRVPGKEERNIIVNKIHTQVRPSKSFRIDKVHKLQSVDKFVNDDRILVSGESGIRTLDILNRNVQVPTYNITSKLTAPVNVNESGVYIKNSDLNNKETGRYLQDPLHNSMIVNKMDPNAGSSNVAYNIDNNKYIHPSLLYGNVVTNKIAPDSGSSNVSYNIDNNKYIHPSLLYGNVVTNKSVPDSGSSNVSYNIDNNKYIHPSLLYGNVVTNKSVPDSGSSNVSYNIDNNKYIIANKLSGSHTTNKTAPNSRSSRIDCEIDRKKYVKDIATISHTVSKRGIDRHKYIHSEVKLESTRPEVSHTITNKVENIYKNPYSNSHNRYSNMSRNLPLSSIEGRINGPQACGTGGSRIFNLKPKLQVGGMEGVANKPLNSRLL